MYQELVTNKINPGLLKGKSFLTLEGGMVKTGRLNLRACFKIWVLAV
jgi:hypothetical protein